MSHQSLTRNGYVLKKKYLSAKESAEIHRELTFKPLVLPAMQQIAKPQPFSIYLESDLRYYLPRYYALEKFGPPLKEHLSENVEPANFEILWDLLPHQHRAWNALQQHFTQSGDSAIQGGILSLPCAWGKSFLAIKLANLLKVKTFVVVNKDILMKQWKKAIESCSTAKVGIIQRDHVDIENKDIVMVMLHSLSQKDYPEELFQTHGLVVFDECHHLSSQMFSKALPKVACQYTLGLSATPIRKDGLTPVFMSFLGPLFHVERREGRNRVWIKFLEITSKSEYFETEISKINGNKDTGKMITNISQFDTVNYLVLELVRILVKSQPRQILILGARREQLEWLNDKCNELSFKNHQMKYATSGLYYGKQDTGKHAYDEMMDRSAKCDIIWGTNDIAKEGLDIPTLNTLILLNIGHEVEQAAGRILRKHHVDAPPIIIDLVYKCGNFEKHAKSRKEFYDYEGYICHKESVEIPDQLEEKHGLNEIEQLSKMLAPKLEEFLTIFPEPDDRRVIKPKKITNPNSEMEKLLNQPIPIASKATLAGKNAGLLKKKPVATPIPTKSLQVEPDLMGLDADDFAEGESVKELNIGDEFRKQFEASSEDSTKTSTLTEIENKVGKLGKTLSSVEKTLLTTGASVTAINPPILKKSISLKPKPLMVVSKK